MSRLKTVSEQNQLNRPSRLHAIIKIFQRQFKIARVTVLNLTDPQQIQIYQYTYKSSYPKRITTTKLPAIFAHVISTGNSLINVHEDSSLVEALRRGEPYNGFKSEYFTVLPIFAGRETIGAISLTEYDSEQFRTSLNYSTFLFCLDIVRSLLVEYLLTTPKTESLNKLATLTDAFSSGLHGSIESIEELVDLAGSLLNDAFGWRVMPSTIENGENLLVIRKIYNFETGVEQQILKGKIYAHKDNKQGPLALAVHEKKPVIVPNVKWLEGVVHPNTMKFFNIHGTKTAAFIPILDSSDALNAKVVGVFWIEGVRANEVSYSDKDLFTSLMKYMSDAVQRLKANQELKHSLQKLSHFVPPHLLTNFLAGESVVERDYGYLMMLDLKGSTRLAHAISNSEFREKVALLRDALKQGLQKYSFNLQQYEWDAFYFTFSIEQEEMREIDVRNVVSQIHLVFEAWKASLLETYASHPEVEGVSYRVCFSAGDISRGIVEDGTTKTWTFIGNAIAVVSKVEQVSKSFPGQVFADESIVRFSRYKWVKLDTNNQGFSVYGLNDDVQVKQIKAA